MAGRDYRHFVRLRKQRNQHFQPRAIVAIVVTDEYMHARGIATVVGVLRYMIVDNLGNEHETPHLAQD